MNKQRGDDLIIPDKKSVDRLLSQSDSELQRTVSAIAEALGLDKNSVRAVTENPEVLRQGIAKMTESDIKGALSLLGKERTEKMLGKIKDEDNGS